MILDTIWPETISAGNALFKIIGFAFDVIRKIFVVMNQFEVFPGVSFMSFLMAVFILNLFVSFFVQNLWNDAISRDNWFDSFATREPTKKEYLSKHKTK